jgi:hypothetical protein
LGSCHKSSRLMARSSCSFSARLVSISKIPPKTLDPLLQTFYLFAQFLEHSDSSSAINGPGNVERDS